MKKIDNAKGLIIWSAIATILAGIIHLWIAPEHLEHAPAHGILFLIVGIAQIVWGIAVWRRPSEKLYYVGVFMAGWLIVLYGITRLLPAPFSHGSPEAIDAIGLLCKLCEALGMFSLAVLIFQGIVLKADRFVAWRAIAVIMLLSFVSGFATYGIARALEPLLPGLSAPTEGHEEDQDLTESEDHHGDESAPTPEHDDGH